MIWKIDSTRDQEKALIVAQKKLKLTDDQTAFARKMFELYPTFLPTKSLYVDLEGSGSGSESIVSLFWPQNSRAKRFTWVIRSATSAIASEDINKAVEELGIIDPQPQWIVTYAQGRYESEERERLIQLLGQDPWPNAIWINLLHVFQECREMTSAIRQHRNVKYRRDRTQIRRSLESLEWEFGITRNPNIRSKSNEYSDGLTGTMAVLTLAAELVGGTISTSQEKILYRYCKQDVHSMHRISRDCERGLYGRAARGRRYAEHEVLVPTSQPQQSLPEIGHDQGTKVVVYDYCPRCGEEFLKSNRNGRPFSPRQRTAQFNAHNRNFHALETS